MLTAAALTVSLANGLPVTAETESETAAPKNVIANTMHIEVTDSSGESVTDAEMKLIDADGICRYKFKSDSSRCYPMNGSEISYDPIDDEKSEFWVGFEQFEKLIPSGTELLSYIIGGTELSSASGAQFQLSDGESTEVTLVYKDLNEETDLTVMPNMFGIYADEAIADKSVLPVYSIDDTEYEVIKSLDYHKNIAYYTLYDSDIVNHTSYTPTISTEPTEYILYTANVSELSSRFTEDGLLSYVNSLVPDALVFDLRQDTEETRTSLMIVSGAMVNYVVPNENGYIQFYAEKETREYEVDFDYHYEYSGDGGLQVGTSGFGLYGTAGERMDITASIPDFPESGVNLVYVPAGEYTIEFDSVPDTCSNPGAIPVTIEDSSDVKSVSIQLEDYKEPAVTEPAPWPEGEIVYPEGNILNIQVKDSDGALLSGINMKMKHGNRVSSYSSTPLTNQFLPIPIGELKSLSETDGINAIAVDNELCYNDDETILFKSGETVEISAYAINDTEEASFTLSEGSFGVYVDPLWQYNSLYTGCLLINDTAIYMNPENDTSQYGTVTVYTVDGYVSSAYSGLCKPGTEVTQLDDFSSGSSCAHPDTAWDAEYILYRTHISELSDEFRADGTFIDDDYLINPRMNTPSYRCFMLIKSGAMMNAVIPDEDGYVEFYIEKEDRKYKLEVDGSHSTYGGGQTTCGVYSSGLAADAADVYTCTAVTLPEDGVCITDISAGEYTLTFPDLPAQYKDPGEIVLTVDDVKGVQTVEILLEPGYTLGDVNEDGVVDISDATLALTHYARTAASLSSDLTETQLLAADIDEDGVITLSDATAILTYYARYAAGLNPAW